ncbi:MAG: NUDIX hydrolase [Acidobacteriia bacterium]|nr:NUDIX hydrolase [Terriglobia bacterium]
MARYRNPAVTVDAVVFTRLQDVLWVLLIRRRRPPFKGRWALPGGFVNYDEPLDRAVRRELREETGVSRILLEQFYTFGNPRRDPRGRVISVSYWGSVRADRIQLKAGDDAAMVRWFRVNRLPPLAFDHAAILKRALACLRRRMGSSSK